MLAPLHRDLFLEPNPIAVKWALAQMGVIESGIRLPLTEFASEHHAALLKVLRTVGALK
jgi:4-hydroxy-tetrahydrodipicolinate synthase